MASLPPVGRAGIALLPDVETGSRIIQFAQRWRHEIDDPRPGLATNLPHVTVHQFPIDDIRRLPLALDGVNPHRSDTPTSTMGTLAYQPVGWLFADVERQPWMDALQLEVVRRVDPLIDREALKTADELHGYTAPEAASYLRHGYRYVGQTYRPHITVGRTAANALELPDPCRSTYDSEILGHTVRFERLVIYRAGPFGSLVEIIAEL